MAVLEWVAKVCWNLQIIILLLLCIAAGVQHLFMPSYSPYPVLIWMAYMVAGMLVYQVYPRRSFRRSGSILAR